MRDCPTPAPRYHLLDAARGFVLIHMVAFHLCFDWFVLFRGQGGWPLLPAVFAWERFICCSFNLISGMSFHLGRRHLRQGLLLNGLGFAVSAVVWVVMPGQPIWFGVLNLLGCAALLTAAARPLLRRLPPWLGLGVSLWLFAAFYPAQTGFVRPLPGVALALPRALYANLFTAALGFPPAGFYSRDYFPLLPWVFLFWAGYFAWHWVRRLPGLTLRLPLLSRLGRLCLPVYVLHQPVCYALCMALAVLGFA